MKTTVPASAPAIREISLLSITAFALLLQLTSCCARCGAAKDPAAPAAAAGRFIENSKDNNILVELVETAPAETTLDHPDIRNTQEVWLEMIAGARKSIDLAEFYLSDGKNSKLTPVIEAVEAAADRGVAVRVIAEEKFYKTYPETIDRFAKHKNIRVKRYDVSNTMGGIHHAKYFIIDGSEVFVGSQNFDWRSLEHIQELGVRVRGESSVKQFTEIFEYDWTGDVDLLTNIKVRHFDPVDSAGELSVFASFSPQGFHVPHALWDEQQLARLLALAKNRVRLQVLTYKSDANEPLELEAALREALKRGVAVELLVSNWAKRASNVESLKSLAAAGAKIKFMNIPEASTGHIPFARVCHAKYMVVDGRSAWIGTSNWERDYFYKSRNAGVFILSQALGARLDAFFTENWSSAYAETLDPNATYTPPKRD